MAKLLFVGFATIDLIDEQQYLGGAAGAMSVNAAKLGHESWLLAPVSDDALGQWYRQELSQAGVQLAVSSLVAPGMPSCEITDPLGAGSTRVWHDNGALAFFPELASQLTGIEGFDAILLCNAPADVCRQVASQLPPPFDGPSDDLMRYNPSRPLFYIPGPRSVADPAVVAAEVLAKASIVFGNDEEAPSIWHAQPFSSGVPVVCITAGAAGVSISTHNGEVHSFQVPQVSRVLDTTGAGDTWSLGFTTHWISGHTIVESVQYANRLAAVCIQHHGALLPDHLESSWTAT